LPFAKGKPRRSKLNRFDRLFWVVVRRMWNNGSEALILQTRYGSLGIAQDTVVLEMALATAPSRADVAEEVRPLIRRIKRENPTWARLAFMESCYCSFDISEPTVSRYLRRLKGMPDERKAGEFLAFLNNHREAITAFDFFTVPNLYFRTLYCFFVIEHARRRVFYFNVTFIQQAIGSYNNCAKHSRCRGPIGTFCSTMTPSSGMRCCSS
jgi:hypothetical protein